MYALYREDAETHEITMISTYQNYAEARYQINKSAMNLIKSLSNQPDLELTGLQFVKNVEQLATKPPGYYLKLSNRFPSRVHLYQKSRVTVPGYLWNGEDHKIRKLLWFGVLELNFDTSDLNNHSHQQTRQVSQTLQQHGEQVRLIDELKNRVSTRATQSAEVDDEGNLPGMPEVNKIRPFLNAFAIELADYVANKESEKAEQEYLQSV